MNETPDRSATDSAIAEFYVSQVNWLVSPGRDDLIDFVADDFERHLNDREVAARHRDAA